MGLLFGGCPCRSACRSQSHPCPTTPAARPDPHLALCRPYGLSTSPTVSDRFRAATDTWYLFLFGSNRLSGSINAEGPVSPCSRFQLLGEASPGGGAIISTYKDWRSEPPSM